MKRNDVLNAIRNRRSIYQFEDEGIDREDIEAVLEAGRWAPSFNNSQPWEFVLVSDQGLMENLARIAKRVTIFSGGIKDAQFMIGVVVDPDRDSYHFVEDGAVASQNITLAAYSLGLASYWIGIYDRDSKGNSPEKEAKKLLNIPKEHRLISLLPIGKPKREATSQRKSLQELVHYEKYNQ